MATGVRSAANVFQRRSWGLFWGGQTPNTRFNSSILGQRGRKMQMLFIRSFVNREMNQIKEKSVKMQILQKTNKLKY